MVFQILFYSSLIIFVAYCAIILLYNSWFNALQPFCVQNEIEDKIFFSVIIPARNEEANIAACLNSILQQNYAANLYEIIVIDDCSTDSTAVIVEEFSNKNKNILLIDLKSELDNCRLNAYKKKAIEIGIKRAKGNWIVTTDADCVVPENWLKNFNTFIIKNNCVFIAAPVVFNTNNSILQNFQYIDFMALQATTAASVYKQFHTMCNGANLAYSKQAFEQVNGFKNIDNIASGDDMLLMNKIKKIYPKQIGYLFSNQSIVTTQPMFSWSSFINQRIRWASKADKYDDKTLLPVLLIVYLVNFNILLFFALGLFYSNCLILALTMFFTKFLIELIFIKSASKFFGKVSALTFLILQPLHIIYIIIAGWLGKFGNYSWKDRNVS